MSREGRCRHCGVAHPRGATVCPITRLQIHDGRPAPARPAPRPQPRSLVGRVVGDRYGVTKLIGTGGLGAVYEAEHLAIGRLVAVKVLQDEHAQDRAAISRLKHEARVAGTIGHPNICAIYDMGRLDDGSPYLVMERLQGETLAARIKRAGAVKVADLLDIMLQVMSALAAAHQKGIVHRDLNPANVFLSERQGMRPVPKLLDFGMSKAESIEDSVTDPKGVTVPIGTPYYLAPEQARGDRMIDPRVDIWAAGVVFYEGLTGRRPFVARNYNALLVQILTSKHRAVREIKPGLSPMFDAIVDRALAKRPEDRFQTAQEFLDALRRFKQDEQPPSLRPGLVVDEQTYDDATTVFRREEIPVVRGIPAAPAIPKPVARRPLPKLYDTDDEDSTIVEAPSFSDSTTTLKREVPKVPRKR